MIQIALLIITLLAVAYAIYTDIKFRYIDVWLCWSLLGIGLLGNGILSLVRSDAKYIIFSISGAAIFYAISLARYYLGELGGGDARFFAALAAAVPLYPSKLLAFLSPKLAVWPFLVTLFLNILLLGIGYQLFYLLMRALTRWKRFSHAFRRFYHKYRLAFIAGLGLLLLPLLAIFLGRIPIMIASALVGFYWFVLLLYAFSVSVEAVMIFEARPSDPRIEEGDKPVKEIRVDGKLVYKPKRTGLSTEDLRRLRALENLGKIGKLTFKEGVPYAPAFLIGLLFSILFGDLLVVIAQALIQ